MPRGNQLILLIILLIIIGVLGAFLFTKESSHNYADTYQAIPENVLAAGKISDQKLRSNFLFTNVLTKKLLRSNEYKKNLSVFEKLVKQIGEIQTDTAEFRKYPNIIGFNLESGSTVKPFAIFHIGDDISESDAKKYLKQWYPNSHLAIHNYRGVRVFDILDESNRSISSISLANNLLKISTSSLTVEEMEDAYLNSLTYQSDAILEFERLDNALIINYSIINQVFRSSTSKYLPDLMPTILLKAITVVNATSPANNIQQLSGKVFDSTGKLLMIDAKASLKYPKELDSLIPDNYLLTKKLSYDYDASNKTSEIKLNLDSLKILASEIGVGYDSLKTMLGSGFVELYNVMRQDSQNIAKVKLVDVRTAANADYLERRIKSFRHLSDTTKGMHSHIDLAGNIWGIDASFIKAKGRCLLFASSVNEYQIFDDKASSVAALNKNKLNAVIEENVITGGAFKAEWAQMFTNDIVNRAWIESLLELVPKVSISLKLNGDTVVNTIIINSNNSFLNQPNSDLKWSIATADRIILSPQVVQTKLDENWFVLWQTEDLNLHCVNSLGEQLWMVKTDAPILGKVYGIKLDNSEEMSVLFSTKSSVYLLNQSGQNQNNFPIILSQETKAGLTLINDGNNKIFYLPVLGGRIYAYYPSGKPLAPWSFININGEVIYPLQVWSQKNIWYVSAITEKGLFYTWNAYGKSKDAVIKMNVKLSGAPAWDLKDSIKHCFILDSSGKIFTINILNNSFTQIPTNQLYKNASITIADGNDDKVNELVIAQSINIVGLDLAGKQKWNLVSSEPLKYQPQNIHIGSSSLLGYTLTGQSKIYLFQKNLKPFANFPKDGNTQFDVAIDEVNNTIHIITGTNNGYIKAYHLFLNTN
ncbi:MAG: hypothetical protein SGJ04_03320 [Bacteroidota bacterium]|nr:hypothetical protein [Bacteroidota bacterium]